MPDQVTPIQERFEAPGYREIDYQARVLRPEEIERGQHRKYVEGAWDLVGKLQRDFLVEQGLQPEHRFIDVGCGSLRAGLHLVDYLDAGNYYGIDINASVIRAGYEVELTDAQRAKLPPGNLRATDRFDIDFGVQFDMAIAQSIFTHMPLNHVRLCLYRVAKHVRPGGKFFATFAEQAKDFPLDGVTEKSRPRYSERNVYWYYRSDLRWAATFGPWDFQYLGGWRHPEGLRMVEFTRTEGESGGVLRA